MYRMPVVNMKPTFSVRYTNANKILFADIDEINSTALISEKAVIELEVRIADIEIPRVNPMSAIYGRRSIIYPTDWPPVCSPV